LTEGGCTGCGYRLGKTSTATVSHGRSTTSTEIMVSPGRAPTARLPWGRIGTLPELRTSDMMDAWATAGNTGAITSSAATATSQAVSRDFKGFPLYISDVDVNEAPERPRGQRSDRRGRVLGMRGTVR
jgi:hypothetical protein